MPRNKIIKCNVSKEQYDRIQFNARSRGFNKTSEYIREIALKNNMYLEQKINNIDKKLEILDTLVTELQQKGILKQKQSPSEFSKPKWIKELEEQGIMN